MAEEDLPREAELVSDFDFDSVIDEPPEEYETASDIAPEAMIVSPENNGTPAIKRRIVMRAKQRHFLSTYAQTGMVRSACEIVRITRRCVYHWLANDKQFAAAFDRARDIGTDALEAECRRRGMKGTKEPVFFQGEIVGHVMKYSDLCLLALLNAYRPERFKNRQEHTGKDGGPIAVVHVSYDFNMKPDDM